MALALRVRIAAGALAVVGVGLAALGAWAPAIAVVSVAGVLFALVTERGTPDELPAAGALGGQAEAAALSAALGLEGRGIVFPGGPDTASRLFVPAADLPLADVAQLDLTLTLHREAGGAVGLVLAPPGVGLESAWRDRNGLPQGRGAEEAAYHLRQAFADLALGEEVVVARGGSTLRVTYAPRAFAALCRRAHEEEPPWHTQGGCPACSFAAILVARAHAAPVRTLASGADGARSWIELEVGPRRSRA